MRDYSKLKELAEAANAVTGDVRVEMTLASEPGPNQKEIDAVTAFMGMATPAAVLALIAENERLQSAARTLERLDYTDNGGELWKPPLGKKPDFDRIDQLKAENAGLKTGYEAYEAQNAALRGEVAKWKNESVGDSRVIYSLSCNLAQRTGEVRELAEVVDDLSALTKRFVQRLRKAAPGNDLPDQALDYLKRKGLLGSPMRARVDAAMSKGEQS